MGNGSPDCGLGIEISEAHPFCPPSHPCLQVKGLSDGGVEGVGTRNGGGPGAPPPARTPWSPPPSLPPTIGENLKKELPRPTSPRPSGRIAMPADSPLQAGPMPPPIFSSPGYPRPPAFPNIYSSFGFNRPEQTSVKPTSTSALGFSPGTSKTTELPSPGNRDTSQYSKFEPLRASDRERDDLYDSSTPNSKQDFDTDKSPALEIGERDRSPASTLRRPSSTEQFDRTSPTSRPKHVASDSTTDKVAPPLLPGGRIYPEDKNTELGHFKTERSTTPLTDDRRRSFSGDFARDSHSRQSNISAVSTPTSRSDMAQDMRLANVQDLRTNVQDLRTNDQEERIKRENNFEKFETLRRLQVAASGVGAGGGLNQRHDRIENNIATIQKLELFQQSREAFLGPGGFNVPLTAPLGIPASDLARIAISVPDPAGNGELSSGSGEKSANF